MELCCRDGPEGGTGPLGRKPKKWLEMPLPNGFPTPPALSLSFFLHSYTPQHVNHTSLSTPISIVSDKLSHGGASSALILSMAGYFQTRSSRRPPVHPWWFLLALLLLVSSCHASRPGMQPFKGKPLGRGITNHFFGFLPRGPVPPSGPSRQHNSIGTEDSEDP